MSTKVKAAIDHVLSEAATNPQVHALFFGPFDPDDMSEKGYGHDASLAQTIFNFSPCDLNYNEESGNDDLDFFCVNIGSWTSEARHILPHDEDTQKRLEQMEEIAGAYHQKTSASTSDVLLLWDDYPLIGHGSLRAALSIKMAAYTAFRHASDRGGPYPEGEAAIARDGALSYSYASAVLKGPFPQGEAEILKCPSLTRLYLKLIRDNPDQLKVWLDNGWIDPTNMSLEDLYGE
jgi:hypothetical protein